MTKTLIAQHKFAVGIIVILSKIINITDSKGLSYPQGVRNQKNKRVV